MSDHSLSGYGEDAIGTGWGGPLKHERAVPLATRIKTGEIRDGALILESAHESFEIAWEDVRLVALGYIEESLSSEGPRSTLRKMLGKMMSGGGGADEERIRPTTRQTYLLDLYVEGYAAPFRLESGNLNYRAFLGAADVSYVSFQNFFRLVTRLGRASQKACFDRAAVAFLARRREMVDPYRAVYDFELDSQNVLADLEGRALPWSEVSFPAEDYAAEWSEEQA